MAPEARRFIRRLAALITAKTKEDYSQVICNIRTRLSMAIMGSVLVAVRGVRGKAKKVWTALISSVSFNLIPVCEEMHQKWCPFPPFVGLATNITLILHACNQVFV